MRIFEKHYARQLPNKTPDDFVFKVVGLTEYIYGDHPFQSFEYVREKMTSNEKVITLRMKEERWSVNTFPPSNLLFQVDLVLLDKADATGLQDDLGHVMEEAQESPQLSPPAEINYDHNHICRDGTVLRGLFKLCGVDYCMFLPPCVFIYHCKAPWDEKTMISTWELDQHFKIKVSKPMSFLL